MTPSRTNDENSDVVRDGVTEPPSRGWLTPGVGAVGAASFLSDTGHEVTTSVLPTFLTGTLGASAAALGVIDGISDALIGVMKLIGGPLANDPGRRGRMASGGYLGTALATGAIGAAATGGSRACCAPSLGCHGACGRRRATPCWRS